MLMPFLVGLLLVPGGPQAASDSISEKEIEQAVRQSAGLLVENYIDSEKGQEYANRILSALEEGRYTGISSPAELADRITTDLQVASKDLHLALMSGPGAGFGLMPAREPGPGGKRCPSEHLPGSGRYNNYGFLKLERLAGNVGYLDLRGFNDERDENARKTAEAAMAFLANTDAVIIDLRLNGGGSGGMADLLASYFFGEERVHLLTNSTRFRGEEFTMESWTAQNVNGQRMPGKDLYLLTSRFTGSAAEHFAFGLKGQKRAVLVGETTAGAGQNVAFFPVEGGFNLKVSIGRTYNPITKEGWEKTGVRPDVDVRREEALGTAHLRAVERLARNATDEKLKAELLWLAESVRALHEPYPAGESTLKEYTGRYGSRSLVYEKDALYLSTEGRKSKRRLIPMARDRFLIEGIEMQRVLFKRGGKGEVEEMVISFQNGREASTSRS